MERMPLNSSVLSSVGYDAGTKTVEVELRNGSIYQYYDVPSDVYAELFTAPSFGSHFNRVIKKYRCHKVN